MAMEDSALELRKEEAQSVVIQGCKNGLGIRIVGGRNIVSEAESDFGIFVKEVLPNSLASNDGRLQRGDQLLESNGTSLIGVSNERAVQILKASAATDSISLLISRDTTAQSDFRRLSASLLRSPLDAVAAAMTADTPRGDGARREPLPLATSTPIVADSAQLTVTQNGWSEQPPVEEAEVDGETGQTGRASPTEVHVRAVVNVTTADRNTRCSSTSSELTQISTTDISSHMDDSVSEHTHPTRSTPEGKSLVAGTDVNLAETTETTPPWSQGMTESDEKSVVPSDDKSVALSDVVVSLESTTLLESAHPLQNDLTHPRKESTDGGDHSPPPLPLSPPPAAESPTGDASPPPVPSALPPDVEDEGDQTTSVRPKKLQPSEAEVAMATAGSAVAEVVLRSRSPPEGESITSPPLSASPTTSSPPLPLPPTLHTITISKNIGLGVIIAGGVSRLNGPHIFIDKIVPGMDAANDGRLQKGDRILAVNGESFANLTRERALTILTQLKIRQRVKSYTVTFERPGVLEDTPLGTSPPLTLPPPTHTTATSVFDSETLPANVKPKTTVASMDTPEVYYRRSGEKEAGPRGHAPLWPSSQDAPWTNEGEGEEKAAKSTVPSRYLAKKDMSSLDKSKYDSLHKRLSVDPNARVKLAKLEWALKYMGYKITPEQQEQLHTALDIDEEGKVVFADFVKLAQEMFAFTLEDTHMEANLVMALMQKDSMDVPAMQKKTTSLEQLWREYSPGASSELKGTSLHPSIPSSLSPPVSPARQITTPPRGEAELDHMRRQLHDFGQERDRLRLSGAGSETEKMQVEKERALQEVANLKMQLSHRDRELQLYRDVPPGSSGETQALRKKLGLMEAATSAARTKENQMTDKLHQLEAELSVLHGQQTDLTESELRKRRAILDCQMKKEQKMTRLYQTATETLLQFTENCHEALTKTPEANRILYHVHGQGESVRRGNAVTGNPRPPAYLSKHAKVTATTLAEEAKETIVAVRKLLQTDTLPFGWEETYTADGLKYYINHETQTTSWVHPVTKVNPSLGTPPSTPGSRSRTISQSSHNSHPVSVNLPT